jgi:hypothetical protein
MTATDEPEDKKYRVYVQAYCTDPDQAETLRRDLEEAVGLNNADLEDSSVDEEEV